MNKHALRSDGILLSTALIWGFAFVAQRVGMEYLGPFLFNGVRFALGCLVLLPLIAIPKRGRSPLSWELDSGGRKAAVRGSLLAGMLLFGGASLQQAGIVYTTAGKAGFITGLYVVIVPFLGLFWRQRTNAGTWTGAVLAAAGLYFLSVTEQLTISSGDFLVFIGAFFFAGHVIAIGWLSPRMDSLRLACIQYAACSLFSLIAAAFVETASLENLRGALPAILYGGVMSVGVAYTLQVVAQRSAHPAHAAIILSLESVFAALGGWLLLKEILSFRQFLGCVLMLSGMLISQLWVYLIEGRSLKGG
ncbi:MAG: DMT family transporter [Deltaproteobacteria bacterium]|nr:DMT family transporter [Deltaproteobacteria bacterium]